MKIKIQKLPRQRTKTSNVFGLLHFQIRREKNRLQTLLIHLDIDKTPRKSTPASNISLLVSGVHENYYWEVSIYCSENEWCGYLQVTVDRTVYK